MREFGSEKRFLRARGQQQRGNRSGLAHAGGHHVRPHVLHRVVNGHARGDRAARRIHIELDVALGILRFEKQQLGGHQIGDVVVDRRADKQDVIFQQPRINVVGALAPRGLFDHHGNERRRMRQPNRLYMLMV